MRSFEDFKEFVIYCLFWGAVLLIFLSIPLFFNYMGCRRSAKIMNAEYHYDIFTGCLIKNNDQWMEPVKIF